MAKVKDKYLEAQDMMAVQLTDLRAKLEEEEDPKKQEILEESIRELDQQLEEHKFYMGEMIDNVEQNPPLNIMIKGQDFGTVETVTNILEKMIADDQTCNLRLISTGVGNISVKDIKDASNTDAQILALNVQLNNDADKLSKVMDVKLRTHKIIYQLIDDVKMMMQEMKSKTVEAKKVRVQGKGRIMNKFQISQKGLFIKSFFCFFFRVDEDGLWCAIEIREAKERVSCASVQEQLADRKQFGDHQFKTFQKRGGRSVGKLGMRGRICECEGH